jgi:hypothetical protein
MNTDEIDADKRRYISLSVHSAVVDALRKTPDTTVKSIWTAVRSVKSESLDENDSILTLMPIYGAVWLMSYAINYNTDLRNARLALAQLINASVGVIDEVMREKL